MWTVISIPILFNSLFREELYSSLMFPLAWLHWDGYTGNKNLSRIRIVRLSNPETRKRLRGSNLLGFHPFRVCGDVDINRIHILITFVKHLLSDFVFPFVKDRCMPELFICLSFTYSSVLLELSGTRILVNERFPFIPIRTGNSKCQRSSVCGISVHPHTHGELA